MSTYLEIKTHLETIATNVGLALDSSDGFEILKQSQNFEQDDIVILNDVSSLKSENSFTKGMFISTTYKFDLWFVKPFIKDDNQDDLDTTYSVLKAAQSSFMFELNKPSTIDYGVENWTDERGKITDNNILGINTKFDLRTACNLT